MSDPIQPSLRVAVLSSGGPKSSDPAKSLELRLTQGTETPDVPAEGEGLAEHFELRVFTTVPPLDAGAWLDQTLHSVIVVFVDDQLFAQADLLEWLRAGARHLAAQPRRHSVIAVPLNEDLKERWESERETLGRYQSLPWNSLGEPAERADKLALRVLNHMVRVLATAVFDRPDWKLCVFLSHAKLDGLYLAQSVRYFIKSQSWLNDFYDADDIEPGWSWEDQLRQSLGSSILLVLRTDAYDRRFWCRSEVRWAELLSVPIVVVDARSGLVYPASDMPFEGAQVVRVPDGNLPRIIFAVLRTVLQSMLFQRSVRQLRARARLPQGQESVRILPVVTGISAIVQACEQLKEAPQEPRFVVYPDPPLRDGLLKAATVLAASVGAHLATPRQLQDEAAR